MDIAAEKIQISGVVQGVGFRPFLYGLAQTHGLAGQVTNTGQGVETLVEGPLPAIENFIRDITEKKPLLARIDQISHETARPAGFDRYTIIKSKDGQTRTTLISPDVCTCADCLAEMKDPADRRFEYPFINCTNCGPRFTIIRDIPYDRPMTSMHRFVLCDDCRKEYENPMDRRFHAQPNACPVCGPRVFLTDHQGREIPVSTNVDQTTPSGAIIARAGELLGQGHILGIKGLGGFHLAVDAANHRAVNALREKKNRPHKPFALMARSVADLSAHVHISAKEKSLIESFHRPIVLLDKKDRLEKEGLSSALAPLNTCLGVMLAYTPLHFLLLDKGPAILVMTSGNRSGEPLSIDNDDALDAFSHIADYFLLHDRDIYFRADDSIVRVQAGQPRFLRRSRGYAPLPVAFGSPEDAERKLPSIMGCGAGLKNTVCLTRGTSAFLSQHIGDLENQKVTDYYCQTIDHLKKIMDIEPVLMAHDMHPGYFSTEYARQAAAQGVRLEPVQHHHAHAVSCMAENHLNGEVIALTLDGTGYGSDGHIWGGEILVCTRKEFCRKAHLSYIQMPGGDAAVRQPWRMAASVLFQAFGRPFLDLDLEVIKDTDPKNLEFICRMMEKQVNSPLTSSAGRLFDAVSSLMGIRHAVTHEGQAAMELEAVASGAKETISYEYALEPAGNGIEINLLSCIRQIVQDLVQGRPKADISAGFHETLVQAFTAAACRISRDTGLDRVVLSGGVFNNTLILTRTQRLLEENGLTVYTHTRVPCGDGGICLGQVAAAMERIKG